MSKKNKYCLSIRAISLSLILSFLGEQILFANPDLKPFSQDLFKEEKLKLGFEIPESIATIEDSYLADSVERRAYRKEKNTSYALNAKRYTLYLLQDAHTNNSGQINSAKALDIILRNKKDIRFIFSEAGVGDSSLSFLRNYQTKEKRKEIADRYLNRGLLHGVEYLDLTSDHHFTLWGVEDPELYIKSVQTYGFVAQKRDKFEDYLKKVEQTTKTLKTRLYNPVLLSLDGIYQKYQTQEISLTDYFEELTNQAKVLGVPLQDYPHLHLLKNLRSLESKIDFKKATEEQALAINSLSFADKEELLTLSRDINKSPFRFSIEEHKSTKGFYALLEEKLKEDGGWWIVDGEKKNYPQSTIQNPRSRFPELFKYFRYLKKANQINLQNIPKEQKALEKEVFNKLCTNHEESTLVSVSKNLELLKKLFNLTLTPDEFKDYQANKQSFDIKRITGFLNKKIMDLKKDYERAIFLESGYEDVIQKCEEFYTLTYDRDKAFVQNMLAKLAESNPVIPAKAGIKPSDDPRFRGDDTAAILITGGYHTPNLKYLLKEQGISYVVITPQILHETNRKRYENILLSQDFAKAKTMIAKTTASQTSPSSMIMAWLINSPVPIATPKERQIIWDISGQNYISQITTAQEVVFQVPAGGRLAQGGNASAQPRESHSAGRKKAVNIGAQLEFFGRERIERLNHITEVARLIGASRIGLIGYLKENPDAYEKYGIKKPRRTSQILESAGKEKLQGSKVSQAAADLDMLKNTLWRHLRHHPDHVIKYDLRKTARPAPERPARAVIQKPETPVRIDIRDLRSVEHDVFPVMVRTLGSQNWERFNQDGNAKRLVLRIFHRTRSSQVRALRQWLSEVATKQKLSDGTPVPENVCLLSKALYAYLFISPKVSLGREKLSPVTGNWPASRGARLAEITDLSSGMDSSASIEQRFRHTVSAVKEKLSENPEAKFRLRFDVQSETQRDYLKTFGFQEDVAEREKVKQAVLANLTVDKIESVRKEWSALEVTFKNPVAPAANLKTVRFVCGVPIVSLSKTLQNVAKIGQLGEISSESEAAIQSLRSYVEQDRIRLSEDSVSCWFLAVLNEDGKVQVLKALRDNFDLSLGSDRLLTESDYIREVELRRQAEHLKEVEEKNPRNQLRQALDSIFETASAENPDQVRWITANLSHASPDKLQAGLAPVVMRLKAEGRLVLNEKENQEIERMLSPPVWNSHAQKEIAHLLVFLEHSADLSFKDIRKLINGASIGTGIVPRWSKIALPLFFLLAVTVFSWAYFAYRESSQPSSVKGTSAIMESLRRQSHGQKLTKSQIFEALDREMDRLDQSLKGKRLAGSVFAQFDELIRLFESQTFPSGKGTLRPFAIFNQSGKVILVPKQMVPPEFAMWYSLLEESYKEVKGELPSPVTAELPEIQWARFLKAWRDRAQALLLRYPLQDLLDQLRNEGQSILTDTSFNWEKDTYESEQSCLVIRSRGHRLEIALKGASGFPARFKIWHSFVANAFKEVAPFFANTGLFFDEPRVRVAVDVWILYVGISHLGENTVEAAPPASGARLPAGEAGMAGIDGMTNAALKKVIDAKLVSGDAQKGYFINLNFCPEFLQIEEASLHLYRAAIVLSERIPSIKIFEGRKPYLFFMSENGYRVWALGNGRRDQNLLMLAIEDNEGNVEWWDAQIQKAIETDLIEKVDAGLARSLLDAASQLHLTSAEFKLLTQAGSVYVFQELRKIRGDNVNAFLKRINALQAIFRLRTRAWAGQMGLRDNAVRLWKRLNGRRQLRIRTLENLKRFLSEKFGTKIRLTHLLFGASLRTVLSKTSKLADRIRKARMGTGLSQAEFADKVGVTEPTVQSWESGKSVPGPHQWRTLAETVTIFTHESISVPMIRFGKPLLRHLLDLSKQRPLSVSQRLKIAYEATGLYEYEIAAMMPNMRPEYITVWLNGRFNDTRPSVALQDTFKYYQSYAGIVSKATGEPFTLSWITLGSAEEDAINRSADIPDLLEIFRLSLGLTATQVAIALNIPPSTLRSWEVGKAHFRNVADTQKLKPLINFYAKALGKSEIALTQMIANRFEDFKLKKTGGETNGARAADVMQRIENLLENFEKLLLGLPETGQLQAPDKPLVILEGVVRTVELVGGLLSKKKREVNHAFNAKLNRLRTRQHIPMTRLSLSLGLNRATLSMALSRDSRFSPPFVKTIAGKLNVNPDDLWPRHLLNEEIELSKQAQRLYAVFSKTERLVRMAYGLSKDQVARTAGISSQLLDDLEFRHSGPSIQNMMELIDALRKLSKDKKIGLAVRSVQEEDNVRARQWLIEDFGQRVTKVRGEAISQKSLAVATGYDPHTIQNIEKGNFSLPTEKLRKRLEAGLRVLCGEPSLRLEISKELRRRWVLAQKIIQESRGIKGKTNPVGKRIRAVLDAKKLPMMVMGRGKSSGRDAINGIHIPDLETLAKIAGLLGVGVRELLPNETIIEIRFTSAEATRILLDQFAKLELILNGGVSKLVASRTEMARVEQIVLELYHRFPLNGSLDEWVQAGAISRFYHLVIGKIPVDLIRQFMEWARFVSEKRVLTNGSPVPEVLAGFATAVRKQAEDIRGARLAGMKSGIVDDGLRMAELDSQSTSQDQLSMVRGGAALFGARAVVAARAPRRPAVPVAGARMAKKDLLQIRENRAGVKKLLRSADVIEARLKSIRDPKKRLRAITQKDRLLSEAERIPAGPALANSIQYRQNLSLLERATVYDESGDVDKAIHYYEVFTGESRHDDFDALRAHIRLIDIYASKAASGDLADRHRYGELILSHYAMASQALNRKRGQLSVYAVSSFGDSFNELSRKLSNLSSRLNILDPAEPTGRKYQTRTREGFIREMEGELRDLAGDIVGEDTYVYFRAAVVRALELYPHGQEARSKVRKMIEEAVELKKTEINPFIDSQFRGARMAVMKSGIVDDGSRVVKPDPQSTNQDSSYVSEPVHLPGVQGSFVNVLRSGEGARMAQSINNDPQSDLAGVDGFIRVVAGSRLSRDHGQGKLALLFKEDIVAIYSFERNKDILVVEIEGGGHKVLDLSTGALEVFKREEHQGVLVREEALGVALDRLQEANRFVSWPSQVATSHVLMIHLDGFSKGAVSNLLTQVDGRIGENTHVLLVGQTEMTERLLKELTLTHGKHFYTTPQNSLKGLPITHLAPVDHLKDLKASFKAENDLWVSMESFVNSEGKTGVFAFAPITSLMELVASGDIERARAFFIDFTGYKKEEITSQVFKEILQGNMNVASVYPIRAVLRTLSQEAQRIYILKRSVKISA